MEEKIASEQGAQSAKTNGEKWDEQAIYEQHQFQMFPTPDEKKASKVIKRLED
ncbi:hypothetical protein [Brevibacillus fulvus]|uniref:Uncharacterized protein n=1 Tax=Brevibacillus fulvus TaxID=1125967 RepID=A0A939BR23_9BACL|nr:hypothetical protein [Brevibacillus fulvus]MBM7589127.1 hypothetical protein [Brevibacillus fulvus]